MTLSTGAVGGARAHEGAADPQAVLFDMDGTLIDTEGLWMDAEREVVAVLGGVWTEADQRANIGSSAHNAAGYIVRLTGADVAVEEVIRRLAEAMRRRLADGVRPMPGAKELLARVSAAGIPAALVTSTHRPLLEAAIGAIGREFFAVTVAGDEVAHNKPHPEPYLKAASLLGVDPAACVALEDSPAGVTSAQAAGCATVAVPHMVGIDPHPDRTVVDSLVGLDVAWLRKVLAAG